MKFRTEISLDPIDYPKLKIGNPVFLIGSCFSTTMADKFRGFRFPCMSNPFGVTYNPVSIGKQINRIVSKKLFKKDDLFEKEGIWNSFELHGSFNETDPGELLQRVNSNLSEAHDLLRKSEMIFITLGTSWVYRHNVTGNVVNNCHKFPAREFEKKLLSVEEITEKLQNLNMHLQSFNPELKVVYTISPIRHLKDGFAGNHLSKSQLRVALENVLMEDNMFYFPAFEIMMDDLREYRFYDEDLLHPNGMALDYIWDKLISVFFGENELKTLDRIEKLNKAGLHRIMSKKSPATKKFIENTRQLALELEKEGVSVEDDLKKLDSYYPKDSATNF